MEMTMTTTEDLKDNASATLHSAKETLISATDLARDKASSIGAEMKSRVADTAASMRDGAAERIEATREALSDGGDRLADSLRRAADEPNAGGLQARVLSAAADGLQSVAEDLRNRSFSQMSSDVQAYAQRNPVAFAAGAAIAGFMLARLFRSSGQS